MGHNTCLAKRHEPTTWTEITNSSAQVHPILAVACLHSIRSVRGPPVRVLQLNPSRRFSETGPRGWRDGRPVSVARALPHDVPLLVARRPGPGSRPSPFCGPKTSASLLLFWIGGGQGGVGPIYSLESGIQIPPRTRTPCLRA